MSQIAVEAHQLVKKFPARPGTGDKNPSPPSPLPAGEGRRGEGKKKRWQFWKKEPKAMFTAVSGVDIQIERGEIFGLSWAIPSTIGPGAAGYILDNFNPNLLWYIGGALCGLSVLAYYALHLRLRSRPEFAPAQEAAQPASA